MQKLYSLLFSSLLQSSLLFCASPESYIPQEADHLEFITTLAATMALPKGTTGRHNIEIISIAAKPILCPSHHLDCTSRSHKKFTPFIFPDEKPKKTTCFFFSCLIKTAQQKNIPDHAFKIIVETKPLASISAEILTVYCNEADGSGYNINIIDNESKKESNVTLSLYPKYTIAATKGESPNYIIHTAAKKMLALSYDPSKNPPKNISSIHHLLLASCKGDDGKHKIKIWATN